MYLGRRQLAARAPRVRSIVSGIIVCAVGLAAPRVRAQNGASIDLNAFHPAMDTRGYITLNASQVLGHKDVSFGLVTTWRRGLVQFDGPNGASFEVSNVIVPTLLGAFGLKAGPLELELGLSLPFTLVAGDRGPDYTGMPGPNDDENFSFTSQGLGDPGIHAKIRFLNTSKGPRVGLALVGSLYLPSPSRDDDSAGVPGNPWLGDGAVTPQAMVVLDKENRAGTLRVGLNAGIRVPTETHTFADTSFTDPGGTDIATGGRIENGATIPVGAGISYAIAKQKFDVLAEAYSAIPLAGEGLFPAEAIVGAKVYLARNSFLELGAGVGVLDVTDAKPNLRAFLGIIFEPNIGDRDGDGIKDDVDQCPDDPEDYDDFEDEDGCPEPDNDRDGILDEDDQCPNEPEDKDGFEDEDGCPEDNALDRDGDGILDDVDQCPDDPEDKDGFEDEDGCPDPDNDQDGILDVDDLCPDDPEDKDDFEDEDGCPDPDNDKDRILDVDDACPNEPETYNGVDDEDGCPDRGRVIVTDTNIEILDKIYFEYNKAVIKPKSYPILDAIIATLQGNPDILLVEIQGHTDERGSDAYNLDLSQRRAQAVMDYLVKGGVDPSRLRAQGYGERQPVDPRHNEQAWAKNRRVEFLILKRASDSD
ncbi:MAG: OmpA family protein [Deltaproteobacteria bacterium]|nr:MAG: OmpA family protein [Deltaproteobacteria bacterium]